MRGPGREWWAAPVEDLLRRLETSRDGLSSEEAVERLRVLGPNTLEVHGVPTRLKAVLGQLRSPLSLLLVFAAAASAATGQWADATIVLAIVTASVAIGAAREYSAQAAAARLQARIHARVTALRDGAPRPVPVREVVPGDVVLLSAGSLVPGDGVVLEAADFFVNQAALTGESFPVEKRPGTARSDAPLTERGNCVFLGSNARSGTARCVVAATARATHYGEIAQHLAARPPETEFDRGLRRFGYFLTSAMFVGVLVIFAANLLLGRPPVDTLLFSVALAVGLSPELLPAILSVNLSRGAREMAQHGVLVRRLNSIENLGSMDVLCTDKTGTLTEGVVRLEGAYDPGGGRSDEVLELASRNAAWQTGLGNPLDDAILEAHRPDPAAAGKVAEIPYDFARKRLSVITSGPTGRRIVTKGAFEPVLEVCGRLRGGADLGSAERGRLVKRYHEWSRSGVRVLALADREIDEKPSYTREDERDLDFAGFLTFVDRPKDGVAEAIADLAKLGVAIKVISGDNPDVVRYVARSVGLDDMRVLTGKELNQLHGEALWHAVERARLFAEVDPNQKERIILALKKRRHVVGFLGDGVNDAPAMHAADTSLSVDQAVDVARETADFVLLERDLDVLRRGILEGRRTFANTLKYVLMTMSANLGNMVSMAAASLVLPFLPLLAGQILLNNFLSDLPALGLAGDRVDPELVEKPRRWDLRFIGRFMVEFGLLSTLFDVLTFAALLGLFAASAELFRTGWFVESLLTELMVVFVVRTRRPLFRSRPGRLLLAATVPAVVVAFALPYLPFARLLGFVPLPAALAGVLAGITVMYVAAAEVTKVHFYRSTTGGPSGAVVPERTVS